MQELQVSARVQLAALNQASSRYIVCPLQHFVQAQQQQLKELFHSIVDTQARLDEQPRFTEAVKESLVFARTGGEKNAGLWGSIVLWQQFLEQRNALVGQRMQRDIQKQVVEYLKENTIQEELVNSRGEATELCVANLLAVALAPDSTEHTAENAEEQKQEQKQKRTKLLTPPARAGLLAGVNGAKAESELNELSTKSFRCWSGALVWETIFAIRTMQFK